ncbi:hypothetical protein TVAG_117180 [Trichomonas vaginalis G3]|uniref:HECT-type E3 ubiquitin transferase n=1 Tax=Trichomonas vaginalis (strain ATCC PRA-98 / G3) TaxID=412133 RepID=A2E3Q8_TRIV3|nr:ubiquitin-protein transferase protein [Trichomonas vaginalis G3]EAY12696.1 hypothetical protein TVAG_117180 [Trichomonas vaginalis G3]KAI5517542.1 ubiquitin-protein transferase protein [Trichomonas vaginalis G3]|eukprot:XP_001324919.1 hypothetical protein [Trichomonas vaginalis G3]
MTDYPWMFTEEAKMRYINEAIRKEQFNKEQQTFEIEVDLRNENIMKTVQTIFDPDNFNWKLKLPLVVRDCSGEIDAGGLQREFFRNVEIDSISKETPIFKECLNKYYWFNEDFNDYKMIEVIGTIFGCMIINHWPLSFSFPPPFYKKLLNPEYEFTYEDLSSFINLPSHKANQICHEDFEENSTSSEYEDSDQIPQEFINEPERNNISSIEYSSDNEDKTEEFSGDIENYSINNEYNSYKEEELIKKFNTHFESFLKGFKTMTNNFKLECLYPEELQRLIEGDFIDFDELENLTEYDQINRESHCVKCFWNVVHNRLSSSDKRDLLIFITGSFKVPIGGMINIKICKSEASHCYPYSRTCFRELFIPDISNEDLMHDHILYSIKQK